MKRICSTGKLTKGIDVSHWQPRIDFDQAIKEGIQFVICKATEGTNYFDETFARRRVICKNLKLVFGAYHFFHPNLNPIKQAEFFLSKVGSSYQGELPLILDWETTDNVPAPLDAERGLIFCDHLKKKTGKSPIIYGSPYFLEALHLLDTQVRQYPLWVAHYGVQCPLVPSPWTNWTFWQTSETHKLPGTGAVDFNVFNGSLEDLIKLTE